MPLMKLPMVNAAGMCLLCGALVILGLARTRVSRPIEARCVLLDGICHDLGLVEAGSESVVAFRVHNPGSKRLLINEVPACGGCRLQSQIVVPGGTEIIPIRVIHPSTAGPFERGADFYINDSTLKRLRLTVVGEANGPANPVVSPSRRVLVDRDESRASNSTVVGN
jgi:hypothetical protein